MGQTKAVLVVPAVAGDTCAKELFRIVPLCWRRLLGRFCFQFIWGGAIAFQEHVQKFASFPFSGLVFPTLSCPYWCIFHWQEQFKILSQCKFVQLGSLEVSQQQHIWREPTSGITARCIFHHCVADFTHLTTWTRRKKAWCSTQHFQRCLHAWRDGVSNP